MHGGAKGSGAPFGERNGNYRHGRFTAGPSQTARTAAQRKGSNSFPRRAMPRLQPFRLPGQAARQLPDQSTTIRVESSSTGDPRLRGALPTRTSGGRSFDQLIGHAPKGGWGYYRHLRFHGFCASQLIQSETESHARTELSNGLAPHERFSNCHVERQLVVDFPDEAHERRYRLRVVEFFFEKDFSNRTHHPFRWPLHDGTHEHICMMVAREFRHHVEVNRPPIPPFGNDARPMRAEARLAIDLRQQDAELGRNTRAHLVLETTRPEHVLKEGACCRQAARSRWRDRRLQAGFDHGLPVFGKPVIQDRPRTDQRGLRALAQDPGRLKFDFHFPDVCNSAIRAVEWAKRERRNGRADDTQDGYSRDEPR